MGGIRFRNSQEEARIWKDKRQGCTFFILHIQKMMNKVRENVEVGIEINGERINTYGEICR